MHTGWAQTPTYQFTSNSTTVSDPPSGGSFTSFARFGSVTDTGGDANTFDSGNWPSGTVDAARYQGFTVTPDAGRIADIDAVVWNFNSTDQSYLVVLEAWGGDSGGTLIRRTADIPVTTGNHRSNFSLTRIISADPVQFRSQFADVPSIATDNVAVQSTGSLFAIPTINIVIAKNTQVYASSTDLILSGVVSGAVANSFTKLGRGTATLSGSSPTANTFPGPTNASEGILALDKSNGDALVGSLSIGTNTSSLQGILRLQRNSQISDSVAPSFDGNGANPGILRMNGNSETVANISTTRADAGVIENGSSITGQSLLTLAGSGTADYSGVFRDGGIGTLRVRKTGTSTQTISGTQSSTNTGGFEVVGGTLVLNKLAGVNAISGPISIGDGTGQDLVRLDQSEQIDDTSIVALIGPSALRLNNRNETIAGLTGNGIVENGCGTAGTSTLTLATTGTNNFSGTLQNGSQGVLSLTITGIGTQSLSTSGTYTGATAVTGGTLSISHANALGNATQGTSISGLGTLALSGGITVSEPLTASGSGTALTGAIRNLSGNNTINRTINLNGATLIHSAAGRLTVDANSGNAVQGAAALTVDGGGDSVFADAVNLSGAGFIKNGTGSVTFNPASHVLGSLQVNGGTLVMNGSSSGAASVVGPSGTLQGTGFLQGTTSIEGSHRPGNSPGIQSFDTLLYAPTATVTWELIANATGTRGAQFDGVNVTSMLAADGVLNLVFNTQGSAVRWSDSFWSTSRSWLLFDVGGATTGSFTMGSISADSSGMLLANSAYPSAMFSTSTVGNDIVLNYSPVPEPSTWSAIAISVVALAFLRKRKQPIV